VNKGVLGFPRGKVVRLGTTWIDLAPYMQNGWSVYLPAAFMRDALGFVHMQGEILAGTTAADTVVCTLPIGFRVKASVVSGANGRMSFVLPGNSGGVRGFNVVADGTIQLQNTTNGGEVLPIDAVCFPTFAQGSYSA
jgi:hypothetical protein